VSGAGNQQERLSSQEARRWFIAGIVEGEGSVCVSIKRHPTAAFGYFIQPEFFVYQHRNRRSLLEMAREEFGSGSIFPKPGNEDVLVLKIAGRQVLTDVVVPFLERYMPFSARVADYETFGTVVYLINVGWHRTADGLADLVELAYSMNGNGKHRRVRKEEILDRILRGHTLNTSSQGEDMVRPSRRRGELDGTRNGLARRRSAGE
jgi:hypothetical protein